MSIAIVIIALGIALHGLIYGPLVRPGDLDCEFDAVRTQKHKDINK